MPNDDNKSTAGQNTGATAAGMQISGAQIFEQETDSNVDTSSVSEQDVQDAFGVQPVGVQPEGKSKDNPFAEPTVADKVSEQVGEVLSGNTAGVTEAAKDALGKVKETAGAVASQAFGQVQEKAGAAFDEKKQSVSHGLTSVADGIRKLGDSLRGDDGDSQNQIIATATKYGDTLADQVESISGYIERQDIRGLANDLQGFARRNPAIFVGGAFALGLLAARFFKSSPRSSADFAELPAYEEENTQPKPKRGRKKNNNTGDLKTENQGAEI